jgi:voltage-gated potassium channel Kch
MDTLRTMLAEPRSETAAGPTVLVVGDTYVASTVARALDAAVGVHLLTDDRGVAGHADGVPVWLAVDAEPDPEAAEVERRDATSLHPGEITDLAALDASGAPDADVAVVAVGSDARSLLVARLLRTEFETAEVVSVVEDPRSEETFERVVPETVCVADLVAATVTETLDERLSVARHA